MREVIVVGAGTAGSVAAIEAAKNGFDTLLIEKEPLPRYKLCGGAISKKTISLLERRGIAIKDDVVEQRVNQVKITTPRVTRSIADKETIAVLTYRNKFDYFLTSIVRDEGAEILEGTRVKDITIHKDHCKIKTNKGEFETGYIIGADGVNSIVGRKSGLSKRLPSDQVIVTAEVEVPVENIEEVVNPHSMEFHFGIMPFGYAWVFPKKHALTIGVGNLMSELRGVSVRDKLYEFAMHFPLEDNLPKPKSHLIPIGGFQRSMANERVMLCGDAAGLVDMTAGEGIYYAIHSSVLAVEALKNVYEGKESSVKVYEKRCNSVIMPELKASLKLAKWLYNNLDLFYYMVEHEKRIMPIFLSIAKLDRSFGEIYRQVMLLGIKNYIRRLVFH